MIRPRLKRLHSPDTSDLGSFRPSDPEVFSILVQAMIGPEDQVGEESFDFFVCSPAWLARQCEVQGPVVGRHLLIMNHFRVKDVEHTIRSLCAQVRASTWTEAADQLGCYGQWEFEDYEPYVGS